MQYESSTASFNAGSGDKRSEKSLRADFTTGRSRSSPASYAALEREPNARACSSQPKQHGNTSSIDREEAFIAELGGARRLLSVMHTRSAAQVRKEAFERYTYVERH